MNIEYKHSEAILTVPKKAPDPIVSVVVLKFKGKPEVVNAPVISR